QRGVGGVGGLLGGGVGGGAGQVRLGREGPAGGERQDLVGAPRDLVDALVVVVAGDADQVADHVSRRDPASGVVAGDGVQGAGGGTKVTGPGEDGAGAPPPLLMTGAAAASAVA